MSGYDTPTPLLAHEERVDLSLFYPDDYNGYLPASLEVADLNGDDIDEVYVAYQEGDPSDRGAVYRTNIAVIDTALSEDDTVDAPLLRRLPHARRRPPRFQRPEADSADRVHAACKRGRQSRLRR